MASRSGRTPSQPLRASSSRAPSNRSSATFRSSDVAACDPDATPLRSVGCAMAAQRRSPARSADTGLHRLGDEDLMQLVAGGDARAFEVVYERHCTVVFSLAYRI